MRFLLLLLLSSTTLFAQVGVNNPAPEQALDVGGKIKLADDATTPTAGTIRYESAQAEFQGYNGSSWQAFSGGGSGGGVPFVGAEPVRGSFATIPAGSNGTGLASFRYMRSNESLGALQPGKLLVITQIIPSTTFQSNGSYSIQVAHYEFGNRNPFVRYNLGSTTGGWSPLTASMAPLMIMRPGDTLEFYSSSSIPMTCIVIGFLVDDLDY